MPDDESGAPPRASPYKPVRARWKAEWEKREKEDSLESKFPLDKPLAPSGGLSRLLLLSLKTHYVLLPTSI
ncbi:hypothetical protein PAAG_05423 [Paracoccidioides lutzii Pb01]|uniref:Uncharacterized protein n=1 Tax=Paracoccidioides lutzii (strain ATCC MYA-826 / Pb01) TaxID=502779 RepID=C1H3T0_PARBA|nr:hypothetical protein PAAG_05423 [Paracoccidioides lutzii Pb01]EEH34374.2 hypothetical protein PAAG_05423 [Paracoccidioides lutzii Pb01]